LAVVAIAGVLIRLVLLPTEGLKGDLDQFVLWVHGTAVNGLGHAYDQNLSFPAVMALIWGALAAVEPAFRTVTDSADPWIRTLMKIPASLADLGLAALLVYAFRARPWWAVAAAAAVLLHPAVIDTSAWWGQYESIYVLFALAAVVFVLNGHDLLGAAALAICVMTKPQALPFVLPFVAWFWAHGGWREIVRVAAVGLVVAAVLWLPFVPSGGPVAYLRNLADYQNNVFPVLSLNAWNIWCSSRWPPSGRSLATTSRCSVRSPFATSGSPSRRCCRSSSRSSSCVTHDHGRSSSGWPPRR